MYNIRKADVQDIPLIAKIHVECWTECYPYLPAGLHALRDYSSRLSLWEERVQRRSEGQTFVLETCSVVRGFGHVMQNDDVAIREAPMELHACYFVPEVRRGPAGPEMMLTMIDWVIDQGDTAFCVWAWERNPIRRTYGALGLEPVIRRKRQIEGFTAPEVGYLCSDLTAIRKKLFAMIEQLSERGGQARSQQYDPTRLRLMLKHSDKAR